MPYYEMECQCGYRCERKAPITSDLAVIRYCPKCGAFMNLLPSRGTSFRFREAL